MEKKRIYLFLFLSFFISSHVYAQTSEDFYNNKTITFVVGLSPGGGYDSFARAVARFYGAHIPGHPAVVVQNMPGAGSLTSVLYLDNTAPKDGTVTAIFNPGIITDAITSPATAKKKFTDLAWIGSFTDSYRMCYFTDRSGIKVFDDLKRSKIINVGGGGGIATAAYNDVGILKNLMKLNVKPIVGYPGRAEVHLAMERGELDGECGTIEGIPEQWIKDGTLHVVAKTAPGDGAGIPKTTPWLGQFLNNQDDIDVLNMLTMTNRLGRPFVANMNIPPNRLAILRDGFDQTMLDRDFIEAAKIQGLNINPTAGNEAAQIVKKIYDVPASIAARAREVIK